ncbi:MAG: hypothetical protein IIC01_03840 [Planctomycetes bacterium]|nr:hypothetical protein [Planctomycetota bacterium]
MKTGQRLLLGLGLGLVLTTAGASAADMGTAFTYQGFLEDGGGPVTATCDFEFILWDALAAGSKKGNSPQSASGVSVDDGLFTVAIDFGSGAFNGDARWLGIKVCCPTTACALETLDPRVELTPAPYTLRAWEGVGPPNALEVDTTTGFVGIGTTSPNAKLEVTGTIHSTSGGFKFPDGTVQSSAAIATVGTGARNPLQIALLRWYEANESGVTFNVGSSPGGVAFDGANIWVANLVSNTVTKLRASDGAVLGTFSVGIGPIGVAFDGANIWVVNALIWQRYFLFLRLPRLRRLRYDASLRS